MKKNKKEEGFATTVAKGTIASAIGSIIGEWLRGAFKASHNESLKWLAPFTKSVFALGMFAALAGLVLKDKEPRIISTAMLIFGAALITAAIFAPIVALFDPLAAFAYVGIVITIFTIAAVMLSRG